MTDQVDHDPQGKATSKNGDVVEFRKVKYKNGQAPKPKADTGGKLRIAEVYLGLADAINRLPVSLLAPFPHKLGVIEPEKGKRLPILISDDDVVEFVGKDFVRDAIIRYTAGELAYATEFLIGPKQAAEAAGYWMAMASPLDAKTVAYTRWMDEPGLTYRRLPWAQQTGRTPTWDELLGNMTNQNAFRDWVGSLFFDEANTHNYVWIYGDGGDGKGTISRFFADVFGNSYQAKTAPNTDKAGNVDKFWAFNLLSARLACFPDCDSPTFPTSGVFKSITGGDPMAMEAKGSIAFTATPRARPLILANCQPAITGGRSNVRRIIYCEIEAPEFDWKGVQARLWDEGGFFISNCVQRYIERYPGHEPLVTDQTNDLDAIKHVVDVNEQHFTSFFNNNFELSSDVGAHVTAFDLSVAAAEVWPGRRKIYSEFLQWLKRVHGVTWKNSRLQEGKRPDRIYPGIVRRRAAYGDASCVPRFD